MALHFSSSGTSHVGERVLVLLRDHAQVHVELERLAQGPGTSSSVNAIVTCGVLALICQRAFLAGGRAVPRARGPCCAQSARMRGLDDLLADGVGIGTVLVRLYVVGGDAQVGRLERLVLGVHRELLPMVREPVRKVGGQQAEHGVEEVGSRRLLAIVVGGHGHLLRPVHLADRAVAGAGEGVCAALKGAAGGAGEAHTGTSTRFDLSPSKAGNARAQKLMTWPRSSVFDIGFWFRMHQPSNTFSSAIRRRAASCITRVQTPIRAAMSVISACDALALTEPAVRHVNAARWSVARWSVVLLQAVGACSAIAPLTFAATAMAAFVCDGSQRRAPTRALLTTVRDPSILLSRAQTGVWGGPRAHYSSPCAPTCAQGEE